MSRPSSRPPSIAPSTRSSTPYSQHLPPPPLPPQPPPSLRPLTSLSASADPANHNKLSHRLFHMFDSAKYAHFVALVTIIELANVPQLQGEFAVRWKFRGRRSTRGTVDVANGGGSGAGGGGITPLRGKPSLPNMKISQAGGGVGAGGSGPLLHPSGSTASLRSGVDITLTKPTGASGRPPKANTLPPGVGEGPRVAKKGSDPTPLRQVLTGQELRPVDSPESIAEGEERAGRGGAAGRIGRLTEEPPSIHGRDSSEGSTSSSSTGTEGGARRAGTAAGYSLSETHRPPHSASLVLPASASSSTSQLSFPRVVSSGSVPPPARSGTTPSAAVIIDKVPQNPYLAPQLPPTVPPLSSTRPSASRRTSMTSTHSPSSTSSALPLHRTRSSSGPGASAFHPFASSSSSGAGAASAMRSAHRKGVTPGRPLKSHTCTWDFELEHPLRLPLSRPNPSAASGASTPRQRNLPVLGAGALSDSGIRLVIEQMGYTPPSANGNGNGNGNGSSHHAKSASQSSKDAGKGKDERGGRTVFGMVDIDLAAFASKTGGKQTRRFLLKGSRTNATIKIAVEMRWVGGEEAWVAPAMQDGHHVTGMNDLVGSEAQENVRNDLFLAKSTSNSSSSTTSLMSRPNSGHSSAFASRNHSSASLSLSATQSHPVPPIAYKSFEHHLKTPSDSTAPSSDPPSPRRSPLRLRKTHHHHHHSHHMRSLSSPQGPRMRTGLHSLPPEVIIEAVFNPHPATEEGPFTFVPDEAGGLERADDVLERVMAAEQDEAASAGGASGDAEGGGGGRRSKKEGHRGLGWLRGRKAAKVS